MTIEVKAKDLLNDKMKTIEPEVTADDRKEAEYQLDVSPPTISKYLRGDVSNADLGLKLYEFFTNRIRERVERINATT